MLLLHTLRHVSRIVSVSLLVQSSAGIQSISFSPSALPFLSVSALPVVSVFPPSVASLHSCVPLVLVWLSVHSFGRVDPWLTVRPSAFVWMDDSGCQLMSINPIFTCIPLLLVF